MAKHRIAVVVGSLRKGSLTRRLATAMGAAAAERLDCRIAEIADLPLYDPDIDHEPPAPWVRFRQEIAAADGVLFVTPEYNRSIPGALKNAIDVGSRPYGRSAWAKKPAAVITASPGSLGGFGCNHHLRQCAVFLDMPMMQQPEAYLGHVGDEQFAPDGTLIDRSLKEMVAKLATAYADWVDLVQAGRTAVNGGATARP